MATVKDRQTWGDGFRVLCVDDDLMSLRLRAEILERYGCNVTIVSDPTQVCRMDVASFDLIILDFDMPGVNGRDLFLMLRRRGASGPIMLLSGSLDSVSFETRRLFTICLTKAGCVTAFLGEVRQLLEVSRLEPSYT